LQAGKSIADVAAEKNVAVDTIVEAVVTPRADRLNELVTNGQLTQEQADAMLAEMNTRDTERINTQGLPQGRGFGFSGDGGCDRPGMGGRFGGRFGGPENSLMAVVTEKLGLTRAELVTELQAGKSIADVAAGKNVSLDTIVDAILAPRTDRLNELVANGQLTQEEVDTRLSNLRVDLIERLNQNWTAQNAAPGAEPDGSGSY
jgi:polyhydroxyalkanoate synthesis regulator phasin